MTKTPEEKANTYAVENIDSASSIFQGLSTQYQDDIFDAVENAYSAGYHYRDEEVKELREALKEAISLICQGTEYEVEVKPYVDFAAQAKQLLREEA